ncbi:hypothetical protein [Nostoc sp.]|uniref:hypothetical protein n=1 Tax=Nostoc sp. TaxID=1180 RepID=UPI002FFB6DFC
MIQLFEQWGCKKVFQRSLRLALVSPRNIATNPYYFVNLQKSWVTEVSDICW